MKKLIGLFLLSGFAFYGCGPEWIPPEEGRVNLSALEPGQKTQYASHFLTLTCNNNRLDFLPMGDTLILEVAEINGQLTFMEYLLVRSTNFPTGFFSDTVFRPIKVRRNRIEFLEMEDSTKGLDIFKGIFGLSSDVLDLNPSSTENFGPDIEDCFVGALPSKWPNSVIGRVNRLGTTEIDLADQFVSIKGNKEKSPELSSLIFYDAQEVNIRFMYDHLFDGIGTGTEAWVKIP